MNTSIKKAIPKRRGRPATGKAPTRTLRLTDEFIAKVDGWAARQSDEPGRSEAMRRLVELGLTVKSKGPPASEGHKLRAREMAGKAIDRMTDTTAHPDDQATRKRHLLKGPEEFRNVRVDRPKRKT